MAMDRNTRVLLFAFTLALLLNGLNPWLLPPNAGANEETPASTSTRSVDCVMAIESPGRNSTGGESLKMKLISIEAALNDIKLTLKGVDRKINQLPSSYPKEPR